MAEPFSWSALFVSLALQGAQYVVNRLFGGNQAIQRGQLQGEINIQNSQTGAFIVEVFGGDVSEFLDDTSGPDTLTIDEDYQVLLVPGTGAAIVIGDSFAWHKAESISWAANNDDLNCVYNFTPDPGAGVNANLTHYWPGLGKHFLRLSADVEAGKEYFIDTITFDPNPESVVNDFPQFKTNQVNGKPAVYFSGDETYCAQVLGLQSSTIVVASPGTSPETQPPVFSTSTRLTIFLVVKVDTSATGCLLTLCQQERYLSEGERARLCLTYYQDVDAFGFSYNDENGDVYGVSSAGAKIDDWCLITAMISPYGDGVARRIRINGQEQTLSAIRSPSSLSGSGSNLQGIGVNGALILGAASTVKQSSKDAWAAGVYSDSRELHGHIAESLIVRTTSEISDANLVRIEAFLRNFYGIDS